MRVGSAINRTRWLLLLLSLTLAAGGCSMHDGSEDFAVMLIELRPDDYQPVQGAPERLERPWVSTKMWSEPLDGEHAPATRTLHVRLQQRGQTATPKPRTHKLTLNRAEVGRPTSATGPIDTPVLVTLDRPGGSFTFTGAVLEKRAEGPVYVGLVRIALHRDFILAAKGLDPQVAMNELAEAAILGLDARELTRYALLVDRPRLAEAIQLHAAGLSAEAMHQLADAGYTFSVAQVIELHSQGMPVDDAVALRTGGLIFDLPQLLTLHRAGIAPSYALAMKEAGFSESLEQLLHLHDHRVEPGYADALRALGVVQSSADVIRLQAHSVLPEDVATFQQAGYDVDVDDLVQLSERDVAAADALTLRKAGYDFSLDELIQLRRWEVPAAFAAAVMDDSYAVLTVDQLVDLHLRRVPAATVRDLRQQRQPLAGDSFDLEPQAAPAASTRE